MALATACVLSAVGVAAVSAIGLSTLNAGPAGASPTVFTNSGSCVDDTYTVPAGIHAVHVIAVGAAGGDGSSNPSSGPGGSGGNGSQVAATVPVTPGETLYVNVAGSYVPGGPQNEGAGGPPGGSDIGSPLVDVGGPGGAASWVSNTNPVSSSNCTPSSGSLLAVAAGGGGGGGAGEDGNGGAGGIEGTSGGNGGDGATNSQDDGAGGSGASATAGGNGGANGYNSGDAGAYGCTNGDPGLAGTSLQGGAGGAAGTRFDQDAHCNYVDGSGGGGGGGGGYFGGGGGGGADDHDAAGGGGGAGASYVIAGSTFDQPTQATTQTPEVSIEPVFTAPAFISSNAPITTTVGGQIDFKVQTTGYPLPSLRSTGQLPGDVFMNDNGDGTADIVGSPAAFSGGEYDLTLIADNHDGAGNTHETSQSFKIYVDETPDIDSFNSDNWNIGTANSFTVQTQSSYPASPAITETGTLPHGLSFVDNHNGTATLSGTAVSGSGGTYPLTLTATNTAGQSTTQAFTVTVYPLPTVTVVTSTANPSAIGEPVTFTATVTPHQVCGYVEFLIDGVQYALVPNDCNTGVAVASPTSALTAGPHTISAEFQGDNVTNFSSTGTLDQVVDVFNSPASGTSLSNSAMPTAPFYFEDSGNRQLYKVSGSSTNTVSDYGEAPSGIATDPAGDVFSLGSRPGDGAPVVLKTTPQGAHSFQGSDLSSSSFFGIGADAAGNAFVADNGYERVVEETAAGTQRVLVSGAIPGLESTYQLSGLAVDTAGDVYFSDDVTGSVYELPPPYTGTPEVIAGGLDNPQGLAVDAAGDLFIADLGGNKIYEVPAGGRLTTLATLSRPLDLAVDASGNLYASSDNSNDVYEYAPPYTGTPTIVVSGHSIGGLATLEPVTPVTDIQTYSLHATVISAPVGAAPTGTVTFSEGSSVLGTASLSGTTPDTATLAMAAGSLPIGSHTITAAYGGSSAFPASTSGPMQVQVSSSVLSVNVSGSQAVGGSNLQFADSLPSAPSGVSFSGSLSGCETSEPSSAAVGLYESTISHCGGLTLTGPNAANYQIVYVDGGFTVTLPQVTLDVTGTLPYQGTASYSGSLVNPPSGVTGISGTLHCTTTESNTANFGTYQGAISGCTGVNLAGPSASDYLLVYSYGGITVGPGQVKVTVTGTQAYGGSATFGFTAPGSFPSGVTSVTGTMSGCSTTVTGASNVATYQGTISGCTGLTLTGSSPQLWAVDYVDGGFSVTPVNLSVTVVGTQPYDGTPSYSFDQPTSLPSGVTGISGLVTGCTTTLSQTAAVGSYPAPIIGTSGCSGLSAVGPNAVDYTITYADGGMTVFAVPTGTSLAVSPSPAPDVYVTDVPHNQTGAQVWKLSAPYASAQAISPNPDSRATWTGVAVDSHGDVFAADSDFNQVFEITPSGTTSVVLSTANDPGLNLVSGVAVDAHGNLFVTSFFGGSVDELTYPYTGDATQIATEQPTPWGVAVDSAGDVFFGGGGTDGYIKVLAPPYTAAPTLLQSLGNGYGVSGLAVDAAGNLYWDTYFYQGGPAVTVEKLAPPYTGTPTSAKGSANPLNPTGMAVDLAGDLFFADSTFDIVNQTAHGKLFEVSGGTASSSNVGLNPTAVAVGQQPPSQVEEGTTVTLTATVISSPPGNSPSGSVNFYDGSTLIGTGTLSGASADTATFSTSSLAPGTHDLTARYVGTATYPTSVSQTGTITVYPSTVSVPVSASQSFGGTPTFNDSIPTMTPPGVGVTGTMTGCATSVSSTDPVGSYSGTISDCSGLSLTGPNASNYTLAFSDAGVTVNPATFTVGVQATRLYGGSTTFTPSLPTLPAGINEVSGSLTGCTTLKGSSTAVGSYAGTINGCGGLSLVGPDSSDYTVAYADDGLTVSSAPLTVTVTGSEIFDATASFVAQDTLPSGVTLSGSLTGCTTSVASGASVGSYPNTISACGGLSLGGINGGNYTLGYADGGFTVMGIPIAVTVTGTEPAGGTPRFTYAQPGSNPTGITGVAGVLAGCQSSSAASPGGMTYTGSISGCTGVTPTGPDASNYAVTYTDGGFSVIGIVSVTVTGTQTYGGTAAFTYTQPNLPSGINEVTGTLSGCATSLSSSTDVGTYGGTISGCSGLLLSGMSAADYVLDYADGGFTVTPATLAVTVTGTETFAELAPDSFAYTLPASLPYGITGVTGILSGCFLPLHPSLGSYPPAYGGGMSGCGGLSAAGPNGTDYTVGYTDGGFDVVPDVVWVTVTGTQTYGGTATFAYTAPATLPEGALDIQGTLTGCVSSDGSTTPVGAYNGSISGCSGLSVFTGTSGAFTIGYTDGGMTVTPANLTVAVTGSQPYEGIPTFVPVPPTLPNGITVSGTLAGCATSVVSSAAVGNYPGTITGCGGLSLAGSDQGDYTLGYADGGFTVVPAVVSVTVTGTQTYGASAMFAYAQPSTLPNGASSVSGTLTGCASSDGSTTPVGTYGGTLSGCGGLSVVAGNPDGYTIDYVDGGLTVTPANLTVAVTGSQPYEGAPTFVPVPPTLPNGITVSGTLSGCATSVVSSAAVGNYPGTITGCGGLSLAGSDQGDYTLGYADGGFTVVPAVVTVAVRGTKAYGGSPTYTYTPPTNLPNDITGVSGTLSGCRTTVTATTPVGSYAHTITGCGGLSPTGSADTGYTVAYADVGFTVTPGAIVQNTPTLNSTTTTGSAAFTDQLHATPPDAPPVSYTQETGSADLTVSSTGVVKTTGSLVAGPHTATGLTSTANGAGTFSYTLTVSPVTIVQGSPTTASVTVLSLPYKGQLTATSGFVGSVTYAQSTGSPGLTVTSTGAVTSTSSLSAGKYTATGTMSDHYGDTGPWSFALTVVDSDLSITTVPSITVNASSTSGAVVTFTKPAAVDGRTAVSVSCNHPSGATYPDGVTTVTCSATDTDDTPSTVNSSFTITVTSPLGQLQALLAWELAQKLPPGNSIVAKTEQAIAYLQRNDTADTCTTLASLSSLASAQSGKQITKAQATYIINAVGTVMGALGCKK